MLCWPRLRSSDTFQGAKQTLSPPRPGPSHKRPSKARTLRVLAEAPPRDVAHLLQELLPDSLCVSLPAAKIHERLGSSCKAFLAGFKIATLQSNSRAQVVENLSKQARLGEMAWRSQAPRQVTQTECVCLMWRDCTAHFNPEATGL